ncbi:hypothetical protein B0A49_01398 [Cryomyces minteri]|uniref:Uncharacterized protein n=1 Tax=Cryomyces minteri TaxID=331657 RepID=A0A4U0XQB6_9PEZI|nr:hypothetical protein B0A49_01398 [Cryomyces minteri]
MDAMCSEPQYTYQGPASQVKVEVRVKVKVEVKVKVKVKAPCPLVPEECGGEEELGASVGSSRASIDISPAAQERLAPIEAGVLAQTPPKPRGFGSPAWDTWPPLDAQRTSVRLPWPELLPADGGRGDAAKHRQRGPDSVVVFDGHSKFAGAGAVPSSNIGRLSYPDPGDSESMRWESFPSVAERRIALHEANEPATRTRPRPRQATWDTQLPYRLRRQTEFHVTESRARGVSASSALGRRR